MARGLTFRIQKEEGLYYPLSENKVTAQLICVFVVACAKSRFSHNEAHTHNEAHMGFDSDKDVQPLCCSQHFIYF